MRKTGAAGKESNIVRLRFDARSPVMTHLISTEILKLSDFKVLPTSAIFCGLLVRQNAIRRAYYHRVGRSVGVVRPPQTERLEHLENGLILNQYLTRTFMLTDSTATSGLKLSQKIVENAASDGYGWNFTKTVLAMITASCQLNLHRIYNVYNGIFPSCGKIMNSYQENHKRHV